MKAAVFDKEIKIRDVAQPEPTDSQALIRVKSAGICGTDLAIVRGFLPAPTPLILGHEFAGEVVKIGKNVVFLKLKEYPLVMVSQIIDPYRLKDPIFLI